MRKKVLIACISNDGGMKRVWFTLLVLSALSELLSGQSGVAFLGNYASIAPAYTAATASDDSPSTSYTPFELAGGMIFVQAELEGQRAHFILDTGAPGLVINARQLPKTGETVLNGVFGTSATKEIEVASFSWAGWDHHQVPALLMDMSHFESLTGREIQGLIGYDFIKGKELFIDYDQQLIRISKRANPVSGKTVPQEQVPFRMADHLPIIKMKVNGKTAYFGLDTGSEVNILHSRWKDKLSLPKAPKESSVLGLDGQSYSTETIELEGLQLGDAAFEKMSFVLIDLSNIEHTAAGIRLDGILGFPFFHSNKISLNFASRKLSLWE